MNGDSGHCIGAYTYQAIFQDFECVHGFEKSQAHVRHRKCIFVPREKYPRMHTKNLDLIMQKGSRFVQMIIGHNYFYTFYRFKR